MLIFQSLVDSYSFHGVQRWTNPVLYSYTCDSSSVLSGSLLLKILSGLQNLASWSDLADLLLQ